MVGCRFGIAVPEDILVAEFNPNVALEYGFMRALGKPTLLLKEQRMLPRADILGTLWGQFDPDPFNFTWRQVDDLVLVPANADLCSLEDPGMRP
jgi:hypothetical protein